MKLPPFEPLFLLGGIAFARTANAAARWADGHAPAPFDIAAALFLLLLLGYGLASLLPKARGKS